MRIRAATLNVWALPEPFGHRIPERMRAIGAHLAALDLDAISFQEVWTSQARKILQTAGRRAGLVHAWHTTASLGGSGLLVLTRLPLAAVRFERFALPGLPQRLDHPDYYGGKGFVSLRLATAAGPVSLINTHLHARYARDVSHEYRGYRIGEVVQIAMGMRRTREPIVAAGDFNFGEGDPEYRAFRGLTGARDLAAELDRREPTVFRGNPYRSGHSKPRRIDFVFGRDGREHGIRVREIRRVFDGVFELGRHLATYSDHAGVLAELEIQPRESSPLPLLDPEAARLASQLLAEGRARAEQRRRGDRTAAGIGLCGALLASAAVRDSRVTRRRLLRGALQGAGLLALTPSVGYSVLSEVFAPDELRAYDRLAARLDRAQSDSPGRLA
jgi:endonuclease/exonuclease/phosphatase family metal-dependent hydrolase